MSWTDWVGLWAALQSIITIVGIVLTLLVIVGAIVYVVGGTILDELRRKTRRP